MWEEEIELFHNNMCKENIELSITKEIVDKMVELFVSPRKKFVRQKPNGDYTHSNGFVNKMFLGDGLIESHLRGTDTIGIFSPEWYSKFITFDVDAKDMSDGARQGLVDLIIEELVYIGIDKEYIHVSISGSKGYHITVFFSDMTSQGNIQYLHKHTLRALDLSPHMVELRPSHTQAVKLPLGINRKTNVRCWFVDRNYNAIEGFSYLLDIERFDRDEFQELIKRLRKWNVEFNKEVEEMHEDFKRTHSAVTIEYAKKLEFDGLTESGTRSYTTLQLAILYNTLGYDEVDTVEKLNSWIEKQPTQFYKTPIRKCYGENRRIANWVYSKDARFTTTENEKIQLYKKEIDWVSSVKDKKARHILFCMLCHYKRYYNEKNSSFFMTYIQIANHSGVKNTMNIKKSIDYLAEKGYIDLIRGYEYDIVTGKSKTSIYKLIMGDCYCKGQIKYTIKDYSKYMNNTNKLNDLRIL